MKCFWPVPVLALPGCIPYFGPLIDFILLLTIVFPLLAGTSWEIAGCFYPNPDRTGRFIRSAGIFISIFLLNAVIVAFLIYGLYRLAEAMR